MKLSIDTNAYKAICKNNKVAVLAVQTADEIILPLMVIAELRSGFAVGRKGDENEQVLQRFLNSKRVSIANPNENTTFIYARLFSYLKKKGTPIPMNDYGAAGVAI